MEIQIRVHAQKSTTAQNLLTSTLIYQADNARIVTGWLHNVSYKVMYLDQVKLSSQQ